MRKLLPFMVMFTLFGTACSHLETTVDARDHDYEHNSSNEPSAPVAKNDTDEATHPVTQANDPFGDLDEVATAPNTNESELYLDKIEYALRAEFPNHKVQIIRDPAAVRVKLLDNKIFTHNSTTIKPEAAATLESIAKVAEHFAQSMVSIQQNYTKHNEKMAALSEQRNAQIADYLKAKHINLSKNQMVEDTSTGKKQVGSLEIVFVQPENP